MAQGTVRGTLKLTPALRHGAVAGLTGTATAALAGALLHTFARPVPFFPVAIAQVLVRTPPGEVDSFLIGLLGHWGARLAVVGTSVAFVAAGLVLGLLLAQLSKRLGPTLAGALIFLLPWATSAVLYPSYPQTLPRWAFALGTLSVFLASGAFAGVIFRRLEAPPEPNVPDSASRRYFLRAAGVGGIGVALGVANLSRFIHPRPDPGAQALHLANVNPATRPTPAASDRAFAGISGLTPEVTPLDLFYVVNEDIIYPDVDPSAWRLAVKGLVGRPVDLTHSELKSLPAVERYQTLECISNKVGGDIVSTTKWTGVPLREILERAGGLDSSAVEVVFRSAGGYSDSMPVEQAMDENTLIAIGMGGRVLPRAHGFPARVLGVGTFGMKNPKWLESIEAVSQPYDGFWEQRGWSKPAIVKTMSRIDTPSDGATVSGPTQVGGIAFSGDRGISKVEVSSDGGRTWNETQLKSALSPFTWRLWLYRWMPPGEGRYGIAVRAYDGSGAMQTPAEASPFPSGATGYDEIEVSAS